MTITWLIISLIIGGILVYHNNQKRFKTNFYTSLNPKQLQEELIKILDLILNKHSVSSNFVNTDLKNYVDLRNLIHIYSSGLRNGDSETILKLPFEFHPRGIFSELSINNNWEKEFIKIYKTFSIVYGEYREKLT